MGERKLVFDRVQEGDRAPEIRHTLTRTDLVMYAGASGDFNPMHHDEVKAKAAGFPSVFGHGMFSAGFLAKALTDWVGVGNLRVYRIRFVKQTWPDDTLIARATVVRKRAENGERLVDIECALVDANDEVKVSGEATAALPA
jgi:acyl dehydratase